MTRAPDTPQPPPSTPPPAGGCSPAAACVAIFGVTSLYGTTFGLMMLPMQKSLGWSRGDITFSLTLMTCRHAGDRAADGWLIDKVPLRPLILWGVLLQSASLAAFSLHARQRVGLLRAVPGR
jgi:hypothetical protein